MKSLHTLVIRSVLALGIACGGPVLFAQALQGDAAVPDPPLRRWVEIQTFTLFGRYHFVRNSAEVTTADQFQYKDTFKARFNFDRAKRFTINFGYLSGPSFISSWLATGAGTGTFDGKDQYIRQLYAAAVPVRGLELQYGGLYVARGESDELTSYDDDGYVVGERLSVRRPHELFLDEVTLTRGTVGPPSIPDLTKRWNGLAHPNYAQVLAVKQLSSLVGASLDYSTQSNADTIRAAVTVHLRTHAPLSTIRYEQYRRVTNHPAAGFALWADRSITKRARLQGGYATIDQFYGGLNADRIQAGRRFFLNAVVTVYGPLSLTVFGTQALHASYPLALKRRVDVVLSVDVLSSLRRTGIF